MKRLLQWPVVFLGLTLLSGFGLADDFQWVPALQVTAPYGMSSSLENPYFLPSAMEANYLRFSIPQSCPISLQQFGIWGETPDAQRIPLYAQLVQTENDFVTHMTRYFYQVNYGQPVVLREIGFTTSTSVFSGCPLSVDEAFQAPQPAPPAPNDECGMSEICPLIADSTRACSAYPAEPSTSSMPIFQEDATPGQDNQCLVKSRMRERICQAGYLPSQFQMTCY